MSYDLLVFDALAAPRDRTDFLSWYDKQTEWSEPHGYNDPSVTTPKLKAWYDGMAARYPNMNGAGADKDWDDLRLTDYSIGHQVIYAAFAWSQAEDAYRMVRELAERCGVGFFDVSGEDGEVWRPS
ncbi:MAG: hypothetical protein ACTHJR_20995 [Sphingomonas sp.]|uniref:hypothetical protein n=1 Tax=Sphingomonas sp. TaxID=28214 RepID=UPI003F7D692F